LFSNPAKRVEATWIVSRVWKPVIIFPSDFLLSLADQIKRDPVFLRARCTCLGWFANILF
jgi:hypothetical protein